MRGKSVLFVPATIAVIGFGGISLLGDTIYEGARSVNGQYFQLLGISATKLGIAFGIGEFFGYFLRLFSGILSDQTGRHWVFFSWVTVCCSRFPLLASSPDGYCS